MEEQSDLYRKESIERIQSPEQLNDYLRITNPTVWVILAAVIVLLAGMLIWSSFTYIGSSADGIAQVEDGLMVVRFNEDELAVNVKAGMTVSVGDSSSTITSVGWDETGSLFALAETSLSNGVYEAHVTYRQTQIIRLLFN